MKELYLKLKYNTTMICFRESILSQLYDLEFNSKLAFAICHLKMLSFLFSLAASRPIRRHRHHFVPNAPVTISSVSKPTPKIISNPDQSLLYLAGIVDSSNIEEAHNVVSEAYQLKSIWGPTTQSFFHKTKSTGAFEYSAIELVPVDATTGIKFKLI